MYLMFNCQVYNRWCISLSMFCNVMNYIVYNEKWMIPIILLDIIIK